MDDLMRTVHKRHAFAFPVGCLAWNPKKQFRQRGHDGKRSVGRKGQPPSLLSLPPSFRPFPLSLHSWFLLFYTPFTSRMLSLFTSYQPWVFCPLSSVLFFLLQVSSASFYYFCLVFPSLSSDLVFLLLSSVLFFLSLSSVLVFLLLSSVLFFLACPQSGFSYFFPLSCFS
jgi:hypothetical protein